MVETAHTIRVVGIDPPGSSATLNSAATIPANTHMKDAMRLYARLLGALVLTLAFAFGFQQYTSINDSPLPFPSLAACFVVGAMYASLWELLRTELSNTGRAVVLGTYILLHSSIMGAIVSRDTSQLAIWVIACLICLVVFMIINFRYEEFTLTIEQENKTVPIAISFFYLVALLLYLMDLPRAALVTVYTTLAAGIIHNSVTLGGEQGKEELLGHRVAKLLLGLTTGLYGLAYVLKFINYLFS